MFRKIVMLLILSFAGVPAFAANLTVNVLAGSTWTFQEFDADTRNSTVLAAWHAGVIKFNPDFTVETRLTDSSGTDRLGATQFGKYSLDRLGTVKMTVGSDNPKDSPAFIYGNVNHSVDKISAVISINPLQSGTLVMVRKASAFFSPLDLAGTWSGNVFINNGKDGIGWVSVDLITDVYGNVTGLSSNYQGRQGRFSGTSAVSSLGDVVMNIKSTDDPQSPPVALTAKLSQDRNRISLVEGDVKGNIGSGVLLKK